MTGVQKLEKVCIPSYMTDKPSNGDGYEFIKWNEETGLVYQVNLRVDQNGFYIYYENINKEVEFIDILMIKDARIGKYSNPIKDFKIKSQIMSITGLNQINSNNCLTIVTGLNFVNLIYINFYCLTTNLSQKWSSDILKISYNLLQVNNSTVSFLLKIYTKIILSVNLENNNKLLIKNIINIFTSNKDEKMRVAKALDSCGLPSGKHDTIDITQFNFDLFLQFYKNLTHRIELETVFKKWSNNNKLGLMSKEQFMNFINNEQRDPRLNEILYPYLTISKTNELIHRYEPTVCNREKDLISLNGFIKYLLSDDNNIINIDKYEIVEDDMNHSLSHYFINSSHNTYLIGHQLTGQSSVEMYRQCLLAGCRCIELDLWNGKFDEPIIKHGYTIVPEILARNVLEAIAECAFKTSKYPVILSFENHCNHKQQAKIAQYCYEFFGDMLLDKPLEEYPLQPGVQLPPPSALMNRIIIKNKKRYDHSNKAVLTTVFGKDEDEATTESEEEITDKTYDSDRTGSESGSSKLVNVMSHHARLREKLSVSKSDTSEKDEEKDEEDAISQGHQNESSKIRQNDKRTARRESSPCSEISALVNYVQPVHFYSFEKSRERKKCYEMISLDENKAMKLSKDSAKYFAKYNKFQLTRVYPKGTRIDSSNFMPQLFWNSGCQLVALNYQTLDVPMQLNLGIFEQNNRSGFILKPDCMRRNYGEFDPLTENPIDGIIPASLEIKVISGQFLSDKRVGTYVEVEMYGLPVDSLNKKFSTRIVPLNGINPIYDEDPFIFIKILLPNLAYLRVIAYEESSKVIGHRILPIMSLTSGYRHITLRSESGIPLILPTLFLHIHIKHLDLIKPYVEIKDHNIWFEVPENIKQFTGRENELQTLHDYITGNDDDDGTVITTVSGLGGIGKSSLAVKYAWKYGSYFNSNVIWINAESTTSIIDSFTRLADNIKIELPSSSSSLTTTTTTTKSDELEKIVTIIYKYFNYKKSLFIYDNTENYEKIRKCLPLASPNISTPYILITSRSKKWNDKFKTIELNVFKENESILFLTKYLNLNNTFEIQDAKLLSEKLEMLPLAIRQAAAHIKIEKEQQQQQSNTNNSSNNEIQNYINQLDYNSKSLLNFKYWKKTGDNYEKTTYVTWNITLTKILEKNPLAVILMNIISYLNPQNIPIQLFYDLQKYGLSSRIKYIFHINNIYDKTSIHKAINLLNNYSMITKNQDKFNVHRLVQKVIRIQLQERHSYSSLIQGIKLLKVPLKMNTLSFRSYIFEDICIPHAESLIEHLEDKNGLAHRRDRLRKLIHAKHHDSIQIQMKEIGDNIINNSDHKSALDSYEKIQQLILDKLGKESTSYLSVTIKIANTLNALKLYDDALKSYDQIISTVFPNFWINGITYLNTKLLNDDEIYELFNGRNKVLENLQRGNEVFKIWENGIENLKIIKHGGMKAYEFMKIISYFKPDVIPLNIFENIYKEMDVTTCTSLLQKFSMIQLIHNNIHTEEIIQGVIRQQQNINTEVTILKKCISLLKPSHGYPKQLEHVYKHALKHKELISEFPRIGLDFFPHS